METTNQEDSYFEYKKYLEDSMGISDIEPPPRPLTPYMRFFFERNCEEKTKRKTSFVQFTRIAVEEWKKLDDKKKEYYQKMYDIRMKQRQSLQKEYEFLTRKRKIPNGYGRFYKKRYQQLSKQNSKLELIELNKMVTNDWKNLAQKQKEIYNQQKTEDKARQDITREERQSRVQQYNEKIQKFIQELKEEKQKVLKKYGLNNVKEMKKMEKNKQQKNPQEKQKKNKKQDTSETKKKDKEKKDKDKSVQKKKQEENKNKQKQTQLTQTKKVTTRKSQKSEQKKRQQSIKKKQKQIKAVQPQKIQVKKRRKLKKSPRGRVQPILGARRPLTRTIKKKPAEPEVKKQVKGKAEAPKKTKRIKKAPKIIKRSQSLRKSSRTHQKQLPEVKHQVKLQVKMEPDTHPKISRRTSKTKYHK